MKRYRRVAFIICLLFLYWCLPPLTAPCQCGSLSSSYGDYWQPQYNQSYLNFSSPIWTNTSTAYNPYQNQMAFTSLSAEWQSPNFQQNSPYRFQQNNIYQIGPYGNVNLNSLASSRLVSAYPNGNYFNNLSYYAGNYGYVLPYGSGSSTYFSLLSPNYVQNDPYTSAQQTKLPPSYASTVEYGQTVIGRVVGSNSLDVNGTIIRCYEHNSPMEAVAAQPLDLSSYMGVKVEVSGDFFGDCLYSANFDGVVN